MPALYVVATPIGNLEDISLRALRLLKQVKLIAAEDTRTTCQLLNFYEIKTPLTSYHEHNKRAKLDYLLDCLKEKDVALVSEAGMPGLSDPGYELITCIRHRRWSANLWWWSYIRGQSGGGHKLGGIFFYINTNNVLP